MEEGVLKLNIASPSDIISLDLLEGLFVATYRKTPWKQKELKGRVKQSRYLMKGWKSEDMYSCNHYPPLDFSIVICKLFIS